MPLPGKDAAPDDAAPDDVIMARVSRLQALGADLAEAATPAEIADIAVAHTTRLTDARMAGFAVLRDDGALEALAVSGMSPERLARYRVVAADAPLPSTDAIRTAEPVFLATAAEVGAFEGLRGDSERSPRVVCLPLVVDGFVLGVLSITFAAAAPFAPAERDFLRAIAGVCAHALARARAYEAERTARQRLERLVAQAWRVQQVSEQLSRSLPPEEVAQLATHETAAALGAERAGFWVADGKIARLEASVGLSAEVIALLGRLRLDDATPITEAMRSGEPVYVSSMADLVARFPDLAARAQRISDRRSINLACLPLSIDDRVVGALTLVFADERRLEDDERTFLQVIARQCAQALERWRLYDEIRDAAARAELLAESTAALARTTTAGEVFEIFAASARAIATDRAELWLTDGEGGLQLAADWRAGDEAIDGGVPEERLLEALRHRRAIYVDSGVDAGAIVPLVAAEGVLGIVSLRFRHGRPIRVADKSFIENIAAQSAHALERARLNQAGEAARNEAEEANRAKDEFFAMLGHELRNPLAPIVTALQLIKLRQGGLGREEDVIERQVRHLLRLVDDLLDVSRITRGKVELKRVAVDVADVVAHAVEIAGPVVEQKRHRLRVDVPRGMSVDGDEERLAQVVANLLNNAARYTPAQGNITIRGERVDGCIVVRVSDDGVGISPELLPRVFDLFVQGQRGIDRAEGGLGLGLTLVRRFVEMHGGRVRAESAGVDRGSEFIIELPALATAAGSDAPPARTGAMPRVAAGVRVLLVDDNADAVDLLAEALRDAGHVVEVAYDGAGALALVERFQPEVAVLDLGLPVMDGLELAGRLQARPALKSLRLVALTGYGQPHDRKRTAAAGFERHLVKPTSIEELLDVIGGR